MILTESEAVYAADKFIDYFSNTGRIDEYLRNVKLDRIAQQPSDLSAFFDGGGGATEDDLFGKFDMHPSDMRIKIYSAGQPGGLTNEFFNERLQITHQAREELNAKYNTDICLFETTSLYGSTKSSSQYDGLKPYMRYKGLTVSDFTPLLHDSIFQELNKWFIARNNNKCLVKEDASSRKLKIQTKMISVIKKSLQDRDKLESFNTAIKSAKDLTEQKRFYMSTYGFKNAREVILGEQDTLVKAENYDRFSVDQIVSWWRKKASRRYEALREDGRLRTKLETWNKNPDEIDIIR